MQLVTRSWGSGGADAVRFHIWCCWWGSICSSSQQSMLRFTTSLWQMDFFLVHHPHHSYTTAGTWSELFLYCHLQSSIGHVITPPLSHPNCQVNDGSVVYMCPQAPLIFKKQNFFFFSLLKLREDAPPSASQTAQTIWNLSISHFVLLSLSLLEVHINVWLWGKTWMNIHEINKPT